MAPRPRGKWPGRWASLRPAATAWPAQLHRPRRLLAECRLWPLTRLDAAPSPECRGRKSRPPISLPGPLKKTAGAADAVDAARLYIWIRPPANTASPGTCATPDRGRVLRGPSDRTGRKRCPANTRSDRWRVNIHATVDDDRRPDSRERFQPNLDQLFGGVTRDHAAAGYRDFRSAHAFSRWYEPVTPYATL